MLARELMTPSPLRIGTGTLVSEIIRLMLSKNVGAIMVTACDGSLVGMVSEGDLIRRKGGASQQRLIDWLELLTEDEPINLEFLHNLQLGETTAASVMTSPVITRNEQTDLREIVDVMLKHGIKRVPITRKGKIVGIINRRDFLRALIAQEVRTD